MISPAAIPGLSYVCRQYGDHDLQRLGIWEFAASSSAASSAAAPTPDRPGQSPTYWIIFIHGGGWRDPRNTLDDFTPSVRHMAGSGEMPVSKVRGFVSIDYRLSSHPSFPQDPDNTRRSELRAATHPDHVLDIWAALALLRDEYQLKNDYVLLGHSAGASLAYQLIMGDAVLGGRQTSQVPLPTAIIGISGIYDLVGLNKRHDGDYAGFISGAFGSDERAWQVASPAYFPGNYQRNWPTGKLAMLAWSPGDTLIDEPEIDVMTTKLVKDGVSVSVVKDITGDHEVVWQDGEQIPRLVAQVLKVLSQP